LHGRTAAPDAGAFVGQLAASVTEKIRSLLTMAVKAGNLAAGTSAVNDALQKGRVEMLIFACDVSAGTRGKLCSGSPLPSRQATLFTRDEMGQMVGRELVGVVGILEKGFADAVGNEVERLKGLLNKHL
jgi:ribosomal protein L7Ae-like RNA K-turn-binding protein